MTHFHLDDCSFCASDRTSEEFFEERMSVGRRKVQVQGLKQTRCAACGETYVSMEQLDHNRAVMLHAAEHSQGLVFPGLLRLLRERWGLTQTACSKLFGAGPKAVAKWESGQVPSGPSALLVQCAAHVPGVMDYLARLADVSVTDHKSLPIWDSTTMATPAVTPSQRYVLTRAQGVARARLPTTKLNYSPTVVELYGEAA